MATKRKPRKPTGSKSAQNPPSPKTYDGPILVLKTTKAGGEPHCNGVGGIKTDFRWPRTGVVECPDWSPEPKCGNGFHGLEFGEGTWGLLKADETPSDEWRAVLVQPQDLVRLTDDGNTKVKFRRGEIVYCGDLAGAMTYVMCGKTAMKRAAILASGNFSSGYYSRATSSGYYSRATSSGDYTRATTSGDYSLATSSGDYSLATSSGDYSKAEQKGASGIAAAIGHNVRGKAGENGLLILTWWDEPAKRFRACVGEVGIGGIEADTWYEVKNAKLSKVEP
jgi:hypothetical protein